MALGDETVIFVCPSDSSGEPLLDQTAAFFVPDKTFLAINSGIWHQAAYPIENDSVTILCILPLQTYKNDCKTRQLHPDKQIRINVCV